MSIALSVRLPDEMEKALNGLAKMTDRTKSYLICRAVEAYLEDYADYQIAFDRMMDKNDKNIPHSEMKKRFGR